MTHRAQLSRLRSDRDKTVREIRTLRSRLETGSFPGIDKARSELNRLEEYRKRLELKIEQLT